MSLLVQEFQGPAPADPPPRPLYSIKVRHVVHQRSRPWFRLPWEVLHTNDDSRSTRTFNSDEPDEFKLDAVRISLDESAIEFDNLLDPVVETIYHCTDVPRDAARYGIARCGNSVYKTHDVVRVLGTTTEGNLQVW